MRWRRNRGDAPPAQNAPPDEDDLVVIQRLLVSADRYVNRHAGHLPGAAVVSARWLTDTFRDITASSATRPLDIHAVLLVRGTLEDYLPTTLQTYLAIADDARKGAVAAGRDPEKLLLEQIEMLRHTASNVLAAVRNQDIDALLTQHSFLRTKFSGSDLDLP